MALYNVVQIEWTEFGFPLNFCNYIHLKREKKRTKLAPTNNSSMSYRYCFKPKLQIPPGASVYFF